MAFSDGKRAFNRNLAVVLNLSVSWTYFHELSVFLYPDYFTAEIEYLQSIALKGLAQFLSIQSSGCWRHREEQTPASVE